MKLLLLAFLVGIVSSSTLQAECVFPDVFAPLVSGRISLSHGSGQASLDFSGVVSPRGVQAHIHSYVVQNNDCASTGGHFWPNCVTNCSNDPNAVGELSLRHGNLSTIISLNSFTDPQVRLNTASLADGVVGRSIVIHDAAGARIGCCTIRLTSGIYRGSLSGLWELSTSPESNIFNLAEINANPVLNQTSWSITLTSSNSTLRGYPTVYNVLMSGPQNGAPDIVYLLNSSGFRVADDAWSFGSYTTGNLVPVRADISVTGQGYALSDIGDWSPVSKMRLSVPDGGLGQVVDVGLNYAPKKPSDRLPANATCQFTGVISGAINFWQEGSTTWISSAGLSVCSSPENLEWDLLDWSIIEGSSCNATDPFMKAFRFPSGIFPVSNLPFGGCSGNAGTLCAPTATFSVGALSSKHGALPVTNGQVPAFAFSDGQVFLNGPFSVLGRSIRIAAGGQSACCTIGAVASQPATPATCVQDLSAPTQAVCNVASASFTGSVTFTQSNTRGSRLDWNFATLPGAGVNVTLRATGSAHGVCSEVGTAVGSVWQATTATGYGVSGVNLDYSWSVLIGSTAVDTLAGKALLFETDSGERACCTIGLIRGRYSVAPLLQATGRQFACAITNNSEVNVTVVADSLDFAPYLGGTRLTGTQYEGTAASYTWHIHVNPVPVDGNCSGTGGHWNPFNPPLNAAGVSFGTGELSNKHGVLQSDFLVYDNDVNTWDLTGRSLTVHGAGGVRVGCCDLDSTSVATRPASTTTEVFAECVFKGAVSGAVWFHEVAGSSVTEIRSPGLTWCMDTGRTYNITAHVHDYAHFDGASCTATGGHYGKLATGPEDFWGPDSRGLPFAAGWPNMEIGDLTGKHNLALKSGDSFTWLDNQVHLSGPFSVLGRSLTVHNGTARIDCCTITRVASIASYAGPNTCLPTLQELLLQQGLTIFAASPFVDIYNSTFTDQTTAGQVLPFTVFVPSDEALQGLLVNPLIQSAGSLDADQVTCLTTTAPGLALLQQLIFSHFTVGAALSSGVYTDALGLLPGALPVGSIDVNLTTWLVNGVLLNSTDAWPVRNGYVYKLNGVLLSNTLLASLQATCPAAVATSGASDTADSSATAATDSSPAATDSNTQVTPGVSPTAGPSPSPGPNPSGPSPGPSGSAPRSSAASPPPQNSNAAALTASLLLLAFA